MRHTRRSGHCIGSWYRIGMAGAVAALALACGGENEGARGGADRAAGTGGSPTTDNPADAARLEALYEWDHSAGPTRDLASDTRACMSQATAAGLPGIAEHIQCMRNLGWQTVQPQG
jgi:hypothetical protein